MPFALDQPARRELGRLTCFSGWFLAADGQPARRVSLSIDGRPYCQLIPSHRADVAAAFPKSLYALKSGFVGDLVLPDACAAGSKVSIRVEAESLAGDMTTIVEADFVICEPHRAWPQRHRSYDLDALLQSPAQARAEPVMIAGIPHFHARSALPMIRLLEPGPTHPWGARARQLIAELAPGDLYLDFGCGIKRPEDLAANAVLLDAIHFRNVDLVSTTPDVPLKDDVFALIVSQAVFEHLADPFHSAREMLRTLKPGGKILIDTAFMQPFHADPSHYFNMTIEGLRTIMQGFEILDLGVQPHQMPSYGLIMQLETVVPLLRKGVWRDRLDQLLQQLRTGGRDLDRDLGLIGQEAIAAGVSVLARKPKA